MFAFGFESRNPLQSRATSSGGSTAIFAQKTAQSCAFARVCVASKLSQNRCANRKNTPQFRTYATRNATRNATRKFVELARPCVLTFSGSHCMLCSGRAAWEKWVTTPARHGGYLGCITGIGRKGRTYTLALLPAQNKKKQGRGSSPALLRYFPCGILISCPT